MVWSSPRLCGSNIFLARFYAGFAGKIAGQSFPPDEDGMYKIVKYEPLGVCACKSMYAERSYSLSNQATGICAWNGTHGESPAALKGVCFGMTG